MYRVKLNNENSEKITVGGITITDRWKQINEKTKALEELKKKGIIKMEVISKATRQEMKLNGSQAANSQIYADGMQAGVLQGDVNKLTGRSQMDVNNLTGISPGNEIGTVAVNPHVNLNGGQTGISLGNVDGTTTGSWQADVNNLTGRSQTYAAESQGIMQGNVAGIIPGMSLRTISGALPEFLQTHAGVSLPEFSQGNLISAKAGGISQTMNERNSATVYNNPLVSSMGTYIEPKPTGNIEQTEMKNDFEEMKEVFKTLKLEIAALRLDKNKEIEPAKSESKIDLFLWLREDIYLETLHKELIDSKFLLKTITYSEFQDHFSIGRSKKKAKIGKLQWMETESRIVYLFDKLRKNQFIPDSRIFKKIEDHFLNKDGEPFKRKQLNATYHQIGIDVVYQEIDEIINKLGKLDCHRKTS